MKPKFILLITLFFLRNALVFPQEFLKTYKAVASDRFEQDLLGSAVAISGNYSVIGANQNDLDSAGENPIHNAGAAYIFERNGNADWLQVAKIIAPDREENDFFGHAVDISGNNVVIGTPDEDDDSAGFNFIQNAGSVYVYQRNSYGEWQFAQKLTAPDRDTEAYFGHAVSISGDYLAIGAYNEDKDSVGENPVANAGAVYLYKRTGNSHWDIFQKLIASDRSEDAYFGYAVSINGPRLAVGAYMESFDALGGGYIEDAGAVYIFEMDPYGRWHEVSKIVASDRKEEAYLGISVCIEGDELLASAIGESEDTEGENPMDFAGAVYAIRRRIDGEWSEVQKIVPAERQEYYIFGTSVSISGDQAIIGSSDYCNTAYILKREENTWNIVQSINSTEFKNDDFLRADISGDYAVISSNYDHFSPAGDDSVYHAGAAYIYESCIPGNTTDPDNILENGDFEDCMLAPWAIYNAKYSGVKADAVLTGGECTVANIVLAEVPGIYDIQLQQFFSAAQISRLETGSEYELTFDARAADERTCRVSFEQGDDPWANIFNTEIEPGPVMQQYSFEFTLNEKYDKMQLVFQLGSETVPVTFDNVRLEKKTGQALKENALADNIIVAPNPANNYIMISSENILAVHLYNHLGMLIRKAENPGNSLRLNTEFLPRGIYLLRIETISSSETRKIILD